jgi:ABC-type phosphate transport system permease subunit
LPVIIVSSQEAIRAVPKDLREASYGMGATKWQTIARVVLPSAIPGILTGGILALSRAIGETAPLVVIGIPVIIQFVPENLLSQFTAMPMQIFDWAKRPQEAFQSVAAAELEIFIRMKSLILPFFAYSSKYMAEPTPSNNETGATTAIIQREPTRAALIPAFSGKREPKFKKKSIDK